MGNLTNDFMGILTNKSIAENCLDAKTCQSWCLSNQIAYVYHNEWLIVIAALLMGLLCFSRLKMYYERKKQIESALILASMLLLISYIILFLISIKSVTL